MSAIDWAERGWLPDALVRAGIRHLCTQRAGELHPGDAERRAELIAGFLDDMRAAPIAPIPEKANEQHYEVPPELFVAMLGPRLKYSCCYWDDGVTTLAEAEERALTLTAEHADLADGQRVLELGCGWGSLTLWMAERYPASTITAVSNSAPQRAFITARAAERGLSNVEVLTADMNDFAPPAPPYDRVVSVEMFEHMRNWPALLGRVAGWLAGDGRLFVHVFCHVDAPYPFESTGPSDWMAEHFFSGGMMPSADLLLHCADDLRVERRWLWSGTHYQRTADAWLDELDGADVHEILAATYGADDAARWRQRWRIFLMSCAELFGYDAGQRWLVAHYRLRR